ncbi:hypothetical protein Nepgr_016667 [Nepenthes gracilis]|uniref:Uncharacterized protein n=1 Tax=Nepenthes gracilis TaxID=150966 RepID=A0AAD3SQZ4_NEPGR|nr:hypothetical protein Nepgr_016667 [Nepenthes gracilis]
MPSQPWVSCLFMHIPMMRSSAIEQDQEKYPLGKIQGALVVPLEAYIAGVSTCSVQCLMVKLGKRGTEGAY